VVLAPLAVALAACASSGAQHAAVAMTGDLRFEPTSVRIPVGGTVTWENTGVTQHTATAVDGQRSPTGEFDSGVVVGTGTFSHTFEERGAVTYACTIHGGEMVGVVAVVP
jgi:plastocyanin